MQTTSQHFSLRQLRWWASDMLAIARGAFTTRARGFRQSAINDPAVQTCIEWLQSYIAQPHPQLGRNGDICPFVSTALRKQKMRFEVLDWITTPKLREIKNRVLFEAWKLPRTIDKDDRAGELTTVNLLLPHLRGEAGSVVHDVHDQVKTSLMRRGVMLAAFYPGYSKPAIYNAEFKLYQSPFPVLVVRPMALHDIVFLDSNREGFTEYHRRFAPRYRAGKVSDEYAYPERFRSAEQRFAIS